MREIIFRGKRVDNGEWVEGDLIQYYNGVCKISTTIPNIPKEYKGASKNTERVIPETVGQYTGLTDKNGKRIFEGDILQHAMGRTAKVEWDDKDLAWEISYLRYGLVFAFSLKNWVGFERNVEIIGNIHDNLELLEAEE